MDKPGISGVLLVVTGGLGAETSMAMVGDVGSDFTSTIPVTASTSLDVAGIGGFAIGMEREGWNDLAIGLRGESNDFAGTVGVDSESLISPSSLGVGSTTGDG